MRSTGSLHGCGAPMVIDSERGAPRCAVCTASDPSWEATTRPQARPPRPTRHHPFGEFRELVEVVMEATWPAPRTPRRPHRRIHH